MSELATRFRPRGVPERLRMIVPPTWELAGRVLLGEATDVSQL